MSFVSEIKRRNVFKVALAYAAVAWLVVQLVTTVEEPLGLPGSFDTLVIVLLSIGFPVALVLAWAFELTPEGIQPTENVAPEASIARGTGRTLNYITIGVLAAVVVLLLFDRFVPDRRPNVIPNSIAVLPFENLSPDRGDAYFAPGLHEAIIDRLGKIQNLTVIGRTTMRQYENTARPYSDIADELHVGAVLEATVRYADNLVRVTPRLIEPSSGGEIWSETYEHEFRDIFAIEADIAMNVANALVVEFSLAEQNRIEQVATVNDEAYLRFFEARQLYARGTLDDIEKALARVEDALALDPRFTEAWRLKAAIHISPWGQVFCTGDCLALAEAAAARAFELAPDAPEVYLTSGDVAVYAGDLRRAQSEYDRAVALGMRPEETGSYPVQAALGYSSRAYEIVKQLRVSDPLNPAVSMWEIVLLDEIEGPEASMAAFESGMEIFDDSSLRRLAALLTLLGRRDHERAMSLLRSEDWQSAHPFVSGVVEASESPEAAIELLRAAHRGPPGLTPPALQFLGALAAYFGDQQLALRAIADAMELYPTNSYHLWRPLFSEVRQLDEFKQLMRERDFVFFWEQEGWPDFCEPLGGDDFVCH